MPSKNTISHLNDDLKFLLACCQAEPSEEDINFIFSYLSHMTDYQSLITTATRHGILPLVYKTLKKVLQNSSSLNAQHLTLNTALLNELKIHYQSIAQRNILMSAELIRIMKLLKKNNIEALAFKGPVLSQMAYGDITLRQYGDLDVLIHKEDLFYAKTILEKNNYQLSYSFTKSQEETITNIAHDYGLYNKNNNVYLELHWAMLDEAYPASLDIKSYWSTSSSVAINNNSVPTISFDNLLLYLCVHGSKHLWERLEWIKDIDLLIRGKSNINWKLLQIEIERSHLQTYIYLGLFLSEELFQINIPSFISQKYKYNSKYTKLINFVINNRLTFENSLTYHSSVKLKFQYHYYHLKLFEAKRQKIRYLLYHFFSPQIKDYMSLKLPPYLHSVYYLIRPINFLIKNIKNLQK